jgi:predicted alpha/beta-hydrolase family hydrolase
VAEAFAGLQYYVLRFDLAYRQIRPKGSPHPSQAARDRESIGLAVHTLREAAPDVPVWLGGQSYGGRQASMAAAEDSRLVDALLLLSYPLHPPGQPQRLRTEHFPSLRTPTLFVHGTRDGFGSIDELERARQLIPARNHIYVVEGGGHGVPPKTAGEIATRFTEWVFA